MTSDKLAWVDPLCAARAASSREACFALLYSGQQLPYSGQYSYLLLSPRDAVRADSFEPLNSRLTGNRTTYENAWFGYLGYELLHELETLPRTANNYIELPLCYFAQFETILRFDHHSRTLESLGTRAAPDWIYDSAALAVSEPIIATLSTSLPKDVYLRCVKNTREAIHRGDFYQANLTRKFAGEFAQTPDDFSLFENLSAASPGVYSAFLRFPEGSVISSSPERFLTVNAQGHIETRPIKGTAPRMADHKQDEASRQQLANSAKDRAENLMIVDLMRNDLSRSCEQGSVAVEKLFEVSTYATLHHLSSTVSGTKRKDVSTLDAVRLAFPPGSMTGAPKVRAMKWCAEQEHIQRGVYSGALGWFGGDGSCDLSVVIRTLVLQGKRFEFQVGGGIVADSDPEKEWEETLTKARGIATALGITREQLAAL